MLTAIVIYALLILLALLVLCLCSRLQAMRLLGSLASAIAAIRLAAFGCLLLAEATERQSHMLVLLVLFLYPEAAFVPAGMGWSAASAALFSAALLLGSFAMAGCLTLLVVAARRAR